MYNRSDPSFFSSNPSLFSSNSSRLAKSLFRTQPPGVVMVYNHYMTSSITPWLHLMAMGYFGYKFYTTISHLRHEVIDLLKIYKGANIDINHSFYDFYKNDSYIASNKWSLLSFDILCIAATGLAFYRAANFSTTPFFQHSHATTLLIYALAETAIFYSHTYQKENNLYKAINKKPDVGSSQSNDNETEASTSKINNALKQVEELITNIPFVKTVTNSAKIVHDKVKLLAR